MRMLAVYMRDRWCQILGEVRFFTDEEEIVNYFYDFGVSLGC